MRTWDLYRTYKILEELNTLLWEFPIKSDDFYELIPFFISKRKAKNSTFVWNYIVSKFENIREHTCYETWYSFFRWDKEYCVMRKSKPMWPRKIVSLASEFWKNIWFEERKDVSLRNILIRELVNLKISPFNKLPFVKKNTYPENLKSFYVPKNFSKDDFEYILP